jgi:ABC-type dipeptide/oligopeptide/nickel transport system ATPase component
LLHVRPPWERVDAASLSIMPTYPRVRDQHIAVFGESGSGKTVLVSSFYGAAQESSFLKESLFNVVADDIGLGNRLLKNYVGMRDRAVPPQP